MTGNDKIKILVVEDTPLNMKLFSELLKIAGYEVLEAEDAEKGLVIAREQAPSLILMDIQLPGMDGITAAKMLKNDEKTKEIKIIALTSFAMRGDRERILKEGFDGYISKPIDYKKFIGDLKQFLN